MTTGPETFPCPSYHFTARCYRPLGHTGSHVGWSEGEGEADARTWDAPLPPTYADMPALLLGVSRNLATIRNIVVAWAVLTGIAMALLLVTVLGGGA